MEKGWLRNLSTEHVKALEISLRERLDKEQPFSRVDFLARIDSELVEVILLFFRMNLGYLVQI
jgi:hypothetical protein